MRLIKHRSVGIAGARHRLQPLYLLYPVDRKLSGTRNRCGRFGIGEDCPASLRVRSTVPWPLSP
jgi:hypothetical protein